MRYARSLSAALALLLLAGCAQRHVLVKLKPDGSGTIEDTWTFVEAKSTFDEKIDLRDGKPALPLKGDLKIQRNAVPLTKEELREKALRYGAVEVDDLEDLERNDQKSQRAKFKFKDITQVKLGEILFGDIQTEVFPDREIKTEFSRFLDGRSELKLTFPDIPVKPFEGPSAPKDPAEDPAKVSMLKILKPLMKDAKVTFEIETRGKVVRVAGVPFAPGKNRITVIDANLEGVLEAWFVYKATQNRDLRDFEALSKFRQIISAVKEVRIEFVK